MTQARWYDVFRKRRTRPPILIRAHPSDWDTAVADYHRHAGFGATVTMVEVTATGDKIREVPSHEIPSNEPKDV